MGKSRNRKITFIPAVVLPNHKNVAIYCRVSTPYETQEGSLDNQKIGLSEKVRIYEDIQSGANTVRPEFEKMMRDAYDHDFDLIFVKSVSRLSRNTADLIAKINKLHALGSAIKFDEENIMSTDDEMRFMLEVNGAFAQWESQAISENIKLGLEHLKENGRSGLYRRKCFGYKHNEYGELIIDEEEATIVRKIFDWYLEGYSVNRIIKELSAAGIKSPKGSDKWPKRTIQTMLVNEKYIGNVLLGKTCTGDFPDNKQRINRGQVQQYLMKEGHTPIISSERFEKVQEEMKLRSNLEIVNGKAQRKNNRQSN